MSGSVRTFGPVALAAFASFIIVVSVMVGTFMRAGLAREVWRLTHKDLDDPDKAS